MLIVAIDQLLKARTIGPDHLLFFLAKRMEAVGVPKLADIPWHGLLEQRDCRRRAKESGVTISMAGLSLGGASGASTSAAAAAAAKAKQADDVRKIEALKRWAREQINTVYVPKLRKISAAVERFETLQQGQGLAAFMQKAAPKLDVVLDELPGLDPLEEVRGLFFFFSERFFAFR